MNSGLVLSNHLISRDPFTDANQLHLQLFNIVKCFVKKTGLNRSMVAQMAKHLTMTWKPQVRIFNLETMRRASNTMEVCLYFFLLRPLQNNAIMTSQCMHIFFVKGERYNIQTRVSWL